jgi:Fasciclin domain
MLAAIVLTHGLAPLPRKNLMFKRSFMITLIAVAVLSGCATSMQPVSVTNTVAAQPQLSTLNSLIIKAGLTDTLKGTGPFTIFAPTNEAFAKVPAKTMEALASDPDRLKSVLTYQFPASSCWQMSRMATAKPSMVPTWHWPAQATS